MLSLFHASVFKQNVNRFLDEKFKTKITLIYNPTGLFRWANFTSVKFLLLVLRRCYKLKPRNSRPTSQIEETLHCTSDHFTLSLALKDVELGSQVS
jgi:hypothetical protein